MTLEALLAARNAYEQAFGSVNEPSLTEQRLSDKELKLTGHAFVASKNNRTFQITVENEAVTAAFIKTVGVDEECHLLQVIVSQDDLLVDKCKTILSMWADEKTSLDEMDAFISNF